MRIGQYVHFGIGGADRAAENLVRGLKELGADIVVFYNNFSIPKPTKIYDAHTPVLSRQDNYNPNEITKIEHVREFEQYGIDILGTHRSGDDQWALPGFDQAATQFRVVETNFHGALRTRADLRIFPSQTLVDYYKIACHHMILPNPIAPPVTDQDLRLELGIQDKFVFGRIARPTLDIYCDINLRAYKAIENNNTLMLYVAPCKRAQDDAKRLGIRNVVFLPSTVDNVLVSKIYNTIDVFCHSNSIGETFGNTIAEAMIHGKPVVSHRGFAKWPQAQSEVLGGELSSTLYVQDGNVAEYVRVMKTLMEDKVLYDEIAKKCALRAEHFHYRKIAQLYYQICGSLEK